MGKISLVGALWLIWKEPRMLWNPFAYNRTFSTRLSMSEVWKPDLVILHPVEPTKAVGADHYWYPVRIYYDRPAVWTPIDVVTTTCTIDITYYPFDVQTCEISFMPYGAFVKEIYLHAAEREVSRSYFTENGEWALLKAETVSGLIDEQFPTFVIVLELRRRPTFVIVNVILPILFMGLLNVLVFFLPASSGERVSFAMTVLLAIAVFLTLVGDNMPKTSQPMSTICYFLLTNLVLSSLIMIVTVLNLNLYHKGDTTTVPECISTFVRFVKCKRLPKRTKVENLPDTDDMEKNINANKAEKIKCAKARHTECVTWREVSEVVDVLFGWAAILWLFITAVSFFAMVATHSIPGAGK